jgi:hypothetical protein
MEQGRTLNRAHFWTLTHARFARDKRPAKMQLGAYTDAVAWLRRSIDANRNFPHAHFVLAAALGLLGAQREARTAAKAGLALNPNFTIRRMRSIVPSDNATYLAGRERVCEGMRRGRGAGRVIAET